MNSEATYARPFTDVVAWFGFVGAWLLVIGALDQALRELDEEEFEQHTLVRAAANAERPPPVSLWWILLPPAYLLLHKRRENIYRDRVSKAMSAEDREAFSHLRDVASAWAFVAAGGALIAVGATWNLREDYRWPEWSFWATVATMLLLSFARTARRIQRSRARSSSTPSASTSHS